MSLSKKELIVKSNQVIEASYQLSSTEQRIVLAAISKINRGYEITDDEIYRVTDQKSSENITTDPRLEPEPNYDGLTTPVETENKRITVPEHIEPEQKKRGFLSRFFLPND